MLYKRGEYQDAYVKMQAALENSANPSGDVLEHMGDILFKLNKPEEALNYWKQANTAGGGSEFLEKKIKTQKLHE